MPISILGDIQNLTEHSPGQSVVACLVQGAEVDYLSSNLNCSVKNFKLLYRYVLHYILNQCSHKSIYIRK